MSCEANPIIRPSLRIATDDLNNSTPPRHGTWCEGSEVRDDREIEELASAALEIEQPEHDPHDAEQTRLHLGADDRCRIHPRGVLEDLAKELGRGLDALRRELDRLRQAPEERT